MKKKNKISEQAEDFTLEQLPHTRPQVFWDRVRNCPGKLLLSGLLLLLFALPLLATDFFADLSFASLTEALRNGEMTEDGYLGAVRSLQYVSSVVRVVGYVLFGLGAAGVARQIRQLVFGESYEYGQNFRQGVRENAAWYCLCFFLIGLLRAFISAARQGRSDVLGYLPTCVFVLLIFPILLQMLVQVTLYTHSFFNMWLTSAFLYTKTLPVSLLFSLVFLAGGLLDRLGFIARCCGKIVYLFLLPLLFMAWYLYVASALDRHINRAHYPELVDRGVWRLGVSDASDTAGASEGGNGAAQGGAETDTDRTRAGAEISSESAESTADGAAREGTDEGHEAICEGEEKPPEAGD